MGFISCGSKFISTLKSAAIFHLGTQTTHPKNHCGEPERIFLEVKTTGWHTIHFSMREDGFEFDKFVLSKKYEKPEGEGGAEVLSERTRKY